MAAPPFRRYCRSQRAGQNSACAISLLAAALSDDDHVAALNLPDRGWSPIADPKASCGLTFRSSFAMPRIFIGCSIIFSRIVSAMFARVNVRCAHHLRPTTCAHHRRRRRGGGRPSAAFVDSNVERRDGRGPVRRPHGDDRARCAGVTAAMLAITGIFGSVAGLLLGLLALQVLAVIVYPAAPRHPLVMAGVVLAMCSLGVLAK